jgi:Ca2+-binding EF-hand superfamily protein
MVSGISGLGSFNAASLSAMRQKMFNQIDSNGDGSIDKSELSALSGQKASSLVDEIFGKMDTDQDSLVSMIEFDAILAKLEQRMNSGDAGMSGMPPPADKVFDTADANGDGSVTQDELTAVLGQKGADVFSQVDTDGDGKISRTEDEAFRAKLDDQMKQNASSDSGMDTISSSDQDWKSMLFEALVKGLTAYSSTSSDSSSLYA